MGVEVQTHATRHPHLASNLNTGIPITVQSRPKNVHQYVRAVTIP